VALRVGQHAILARQRLLQDRVGLAQDRPAVDEQLATLADEQDPRRLVPPFRVALAVDAVVLVHVLDVRDLDLVARGRAA